MAILEIIIAFLVGIAGGVTGHMIYTLNQPPKTVINNISQHTEVSQIQRTEQTALQAQINITAITGSTGTNFVLSLKGITNFSFTNFSTTNSNISITN